MNSNPSHIRENRITLKVQDLHNKMYTSMHKYIEKYHSFNNKNFLAQEKLNFQLDFIKHIYKEDFDALPFLLESLLLNLREDLSSGVVYENKFFSNLKKFLSKTRYSDALLNRLDILAKGNNLNESKKKLVNICETVQLIFNKENDASHNMKKYQVYRFACYVLANLNLYEPIEDKVDKSLFKVSHESESAIQKSVEKKVDLIENLNLNENQVNPEIIKYIENKDNHDNTIINTNLKSSNSEIEKINKIEFHPQNDLAPTISEISNYTNPSESQEYQDYAFPAYMNESNMYFYRRSSSLFDEIPNEDLKEIREKDLTPTISPSSRRVLEPANVSPVTLSSSSSSESQKKSYKIKTTPESIIKLPSACN
jgi:hypothetical protein